MSSPGGHQEDRGVLDGPSWGEVRPRSRVRWMEGEEKGVVWRWGHPLWVQAVVRCINYPMGPPTVATLAVVPTVKAMQVARGRAATHAGLCVQALGFSTQVPVSLQGCPERAVEPETGAREIRATASKTGSLTQNFKILLFLQWKRRGIY